jgi:DNA-directed RNA polymerase specialized sigma24 family protein
MGDMTWEDYLPRQRPKSEMQALMEAAPHEPIPDATTSTHPLREILSEALGRLTEVERFVVTACVVERISVRAIAIALVDEGLVESYSKSGVHVCFKRALKKLKNDLGGDDTIVAYLTSKWENQEEPDDD